MPNTVESNNEYIGKKVSMVIKKEPGDEPTDNNSSNSSSNSSSTSAGKDTNAEPMNDIKLINNIKTESKCGLDLTDTNSKHDDGSRSAFEPHIKFNAANKMPLESLHAKFNSESVKPIEPMKFGQDSPLAPKYPPMAADLSQKYESKLFSDPANKLNENEMKDKMNADGKYTFTNFNNGNHMNLNRIILFIAMNAAAKYAIPHDQIKHEIPDNMAMKRPPYTEPYQHIRSPYEPSAMLKYPPGPGVSIMPPSLPQDLKYTPPAVDMKYKPPENLSKSQFSADNLVKGYDGDRRFEINLFFKLNRHFSISTK